MFLTTELNRYLTARYAVRSHQERYIALQARLEVFVSGDPITNHYLKPLDPISDGVWEIVNKKPRPSLRVFGLFVCRDVFIATHHQVRPDLGKRGTPQWKREVRRALHEWKCLFDSEAPVIGKLHEVATGVIYV
jgi:hypothetical protein